MVSMITKLALHKASAHIDPNSKSIDMLRHAYISEFDLETWTCDMAQDASHGITYTSQYQLGKVTMGFGILEFVHAVFASVAAVWALQGEREKWQIVIEMKEFRHRRFEEEENQYK